MMTMEEIKESLKDRNIRVVAENTGLAAGTIYRLVSGCGSCSYQTAEILSNYLECRAEERA